MDVCSRVFHKEPEAGIRRLALESSKLRRSSWTDAEPSGSDSGRANPPNQNAWLKSVLLNCVQRCLLVSFEAPESDRSAIIVQ